MVESPFKMKIFLTTIKSFFNFLWKRKKLSIVLIITLLAVSFYFYRTRAKNAKLETTTVKRGNVVEDLILSGEIKAIEHAELTFETSGRIVYIGVKEGDKVQKGQLLGKLDTTSLNANYQTALATLRAAEAAVDKVHDDLKDHDTDETFTQRDTRTAAEATKDKAYEAVVAAERALKGASIYAPFEGIVTFVANPFPNVFIPYTQKQFEIVNPKTIYFKVSGDQTEVTRMHEGQAVTVVLDSFPDKDIKGTIQKIAFAPDPEEMGAVYEIQVALEDIEGLDYRLGMTGDAVFILNEANNVLYVPTSFINSDKEGKYILSNGGKKKIYIELGTEGEERTEIKGDINEGDVIYD